MLELCFYDALNTRAEMTNVPSPWYTGAEMVEWDVEFMRWSMLEMIPCL